MSINLIPEDCINIIISYIGCIKKNKYFKICKVLNKKNCIPSCYKDLSCCSVHENKSDMKHIIDILNNETHHIIQNTLKTARNMLPHNKDMLRSIHFRSLECMEIAKPYVCLLGKISHFCCNGKGVMFLPDNR